jgi:hypothetical protein
MPASAQTPSDNHEPAETRMSVSVQTHTDANAEGETRTLSASAQTPSDNNAQVEARTSASAQTPSDDNAPGQQFTSRFPNNAKQYICPHGTPQRPREVHIDEEFGFPTSALEKQAANINTAALLKCNDCKWNCQVLDILVYIYICIYVDVVCIQNSRPCMYCQYFFMYMYKLN